MAKTLETLVIGAHRSSVCTQRYRISLADAQCVKAAEQWAVMTKACEFF